MTYFNFHKWLLNFKFKDVLSEKDKCLSEISFYAGWMSRNDDIKELCDIYERKIALKDLEIDELKLKLKLSNQIV